jgi:hypothetical protein
MGGYLIAKGVSLYAGGFPDEKYMIDLISNGEMDEFAKLLTPALYGYLAGWLVIFVVGVIVQYKIRKDEKEKDNMDNDNFYQLKK